MNTYDKNVLPDMYITALGIDIYNNLWVGMKTGGIARRTPSNQWEMFDTYSSKLLSNNVTVIAASPTGEVWVGFDRQTVFGNGLSYFDGASWFTVHPISTSSKVNAILIDKNNVKWIATDEGVVTFSSPSNVTAFNKDNTGLNINDATGLAEDTFGNIWISTDAGLIEHKGNH
jgi:ligand-binding sensor domain-containing protein